MATQKYGGESVWELVLQNQTPIRVLFIQARRPDDIMIGHERTCVQKRFSAVPSNITFHNAYVAPPDRNLLDTHDAIVLGGSGDFSVYHRNSRSWVSPINRLLEESLKRSIPGFGLCFGHQLLGQFLGSDVVSSSEHAEIGTTEATLTKAGEADSLFRTLDRIFPIHTGHSDWVTTVPEGVDILASNDKLTTQAMRVRGTNFFSTQFHPDMTGQEAQERYDAYRDVFHKCHKPENDDAKKLFKAGADQSTQLLGVFAQYVSDLIS